MRRFCFSFDSKSRKNDMVFRYPDDVQMNEVIDDCEGFFEDFCADSSYLFKLDHNYLPPEEYKRAYEHFIQNDCSYRITEF